MPTNMEKEWVALDGEWIVEEAETCEDLEEKLPDDHGYEIVAVPKNPLHGSFI